MGMKVAKFGGSSLADAAQFKKVREILLSDEDRALSCRARRANALPPISK